MPMKLRHRQKGGCLHVGTEVHDCRWRAMNLVAALRHFAATGNICCPIVGRAGGPLHVYPRCGWCGSQLHLARSATQRVGSSGDDRPLAEMRIHSTVTFLNRESTAASSKRLTPTKSPFFSAVGKQPSMPTCLSRALRRSASERLHRQVSIPLRIKW